MIPFGSRLPFDYRPQAALLLFFRVPGRIFFEGWLHDGEASFLSDAPLERCEARHRCMCIRWNDAHALSIRRV